MEERYFLVAILTVKLLQFYWLSEYDCRRNHYCLKSIFHFFGEEGDDVLMKAWVQTLINSTVPP